MREERNKYINLLMTILIAMVIGAVIIIAMGYNPIEVYIQLFRGAFVGKLNIGSTIAKFVPILLTAFAFVVTAKVGVFNVGVEGELYLGALTAAFVGYSIVGLPGPIHIVLCFLAAAIVGALWAMIPGSLKAYWGVNEICVTILMNYVAQYFCSYLTNGPMSAKTGIPQTPTVQDGVILAKILKPSQANTGIFIAIVIVILLFFMFEKTTLGYKLKTVALNPKHAEYIGINPRTTMLKAMVISGGIGGIAGAIEALGVYGYFLDGFSTGIAMDGMLVALMVKNDARMVPFVALFLSVLKTGALGMERYTGVPKSIVDTIIAIFIIIATAEVFAQMKKRKKNETKTEVA